jgi:ssDNA thymidine ADP-ribosyltransferase DarT-like protein
VPPIYHITPIDNLPGIIKEGGLLCDRNAKKIKFVSIGHKDIKERRLRKGVPLAPGGVLADYVPFYFAPRSPMLYTINRGNVEGYVRGQEPIVHLVSSTEAVDAEGLDWVFTEGHAVMDYTDFFDDFADLDKIDWPLMRSKYWFDRDEYPDRCRRRQAEFLVHNFFPWKLVSEIGVCNTATAQQMNQILGDRIIRVSVRGDWYY